jgi:hypothetical protein
MNSPIDIAYHTYHSNHYIEAKASIRRIVNVLRRSGHLGVESILFRLKILSREKNFNFPIK